MGTIKKNLEGLFNSNYNGVKSYTLEKVINEYIDETNNFYLDMGMTNYLEDQEVVDLKKALKNKNLIASFNNAVNFDLDEEGIVYRFIIDIKNAVTDLKKEISTKKEIFKNQIIFIEHDQLQSACFCGFGEGDYPILLQPEYVDYDYQKELYNGKGFIDYTIVSSNLLSFDLLLEELELDNYIVNTNFYACLKESYTYKIYLLLHKAFAQTGIQVFDGIEVQKPLYIYANEHDGEAISIYVFN